MNRIIHLFNSEEAELPEPVAPFEESDVLHLGLEYMKDPSNLTCPSCGPGTMEVLCFLDPKTDPEGFSDITEPVGVYAAALYCHSCQKAVGVVTPQEDG